MTRKQFIKVLNENGYSYKIEGNKIVVTYKETVNLDSLTSLPPGVEFKNEGMSNWILSLLFLLVWCLRMEVVSICLLSLHFLLV
jgi:hypothetical protein